ncbi:MAG TPA: hypothetical protein VL122_04415 [Nitrospirota bacterium]|nr:hypothetical protein [Nitrospirota bacterium]
MIKAFGHDVKFASHDEEAIEWFRKVKDLGKYFDIVILDLTVRHGMGGSEAVLRLSEISPGGLQASSGYTV